MIRIEQMKDVRLDEIFVRGEIREGVEDAVSDIIADVRATGDGALIRYGRKFDFAGLTELEVAPRQIEAAYRMTDPALLETMKRAARNIIAFHKNQIRSGFVMTQENGAVMGQRVIPIEKVGIYVPGGTAAYPSTVLMNALPAHLAGCGEIVMTTPCGRDGEIAPAILAAAKLAGVNRVFRAGGAQAVAALAYGTQTVPRVDKIVGPGNAYVAEAKRQVYGHVAIDMIAGPSEILVLADAFANPAYVAADMLSQAEHDRMSSAALLTDSEELAKRVADELEKQLPLLAREEIARASVEHNGRIILCGSLAEAMDAANGLAPEHLEIAVQNPLDYLGLVKNAGSVFLGYSCPEALGDYMAGPNHTLPTSGAARFASPLSVDDFVKKTQYSYFPAGALAQAAEDVARFARTEGLSAHARSVEIRLEGAKA